MAITLIMAILNNSLEIITFSTRKFLLTLNLGKNNLANYKEKMEITIIMINAIATIIYY